MGQIAAAAVGVPFEQVRVISGDTDSVPYGGGTYASRATAIGGEATYQAGLALRAEILSIAGALLQSEPAALDIVDGNVVSPASGSVRISLAEIGRIGHFQVGELPDDIQPILSSTRRFRLRELPYIFTNGIHGAYVEVDIETGFIRLLKHWVVEDCGRVINPMLADEQVRGAVSRGWVARCTSTVSTTRRERFKMAPWPTTSRPWRWRCQTSASTMCKRPPGKRSSVRKGRASLAPALLPGW